MGMGLATAFVLVMSNLVISLVANNIPDKIRIPSFIVIIAAFVTIVDMSMAAYLPSLHESLGLFIPLIVVNCIVLGKTNPVLLITMMITERIAGNRLFFCQRVTCAAFRGCSRINVGISG